MLYLEKVVGSCPHSPVLQNIFFDSFLIINMIFNLKNQQFSLPSRGNIFRN